MFSEIFVLIRVSIFCIFSWTINSLRDSVDQAVNSFVIANGLNKERVSIFIIVLHRVWFRVKCLKQGIKNRNSVLNRVGKSALFVNTGSGYEGPGRTSPTKDISSSPRASKTDKLERKRGKHESKVIKSAIPVT